MGVRTAETITTSFILFYIVYYPLKLQYLPFHMALPASAGSLLIAASV
jgi:multisubunit Na+/H+ antiporter MnhB subunit